MGTGWTQVGPGLGKIGSLGHGEVRGGPGSEVTSGASRMGVGLASEVPRWRPADAEPGSRPPGPEHLPAPAGVSPSTCVPPGAPSTSAMPSQGRRFSPARPLGFELDPVEVLKVTELKRAEGFPGCNHGHHSWRFFPASLKINSCCQVYR